MSINNQKYYLHLIISSSRAGHIHVFDSVHDISGDKVNQICSIVRSKRSGLKIDIADVFKQDGVKDDCGLLALAMATTLCDGELSQSKQYIQKEMWPTLFNA